MANYDFSTLNSTDFVDLVCDLLNADNSSNSVAKYKTFKDGKDKGIDILHSTSQKLYDHVGQVKHYYRTGFNGLFNKLKTEELKKVKALDPNKFIIATSVDLGVNDTTLIHNLFAPYIKDLHDIYGLKNLNEMLERHDKVLINHYKLWFSNTAVLKRVLNSGLEFRSAAFIETEFKKRLRLFVKTQLFEEARQTLKENKFIVITGEPGVGKTTLAEMLTYEYIMDGYRLTYVYDDIKEADLALTETDEKQIIYFDDFLGSNAVEINRAKGSETTLRKVLRRIQAGTNKFLVFTTRTFLLNTAIEESENLRRFNVKAKESVLQLSDYSISLKRLLLQNHIEDSNLSDQLKNVLLEDDVENFIVKHQNFTPRSVEFITTADVTRNLTQEAYKQFVFDSFNSPLEIWSHAYSQQITEDDRILLNTLLSFGEHANLSQLKKAFHLRLDYEVKNNNRTKVIHAFSKSLHRLEGGFFILKDDEVRFINPSLIDFLLVYIRKDSDEAYRIAETVCFTSQLTMRLFSLSNAQYVKIPENLEVRLLNDYYSFVNPDTADLDLIRLALVIYRYIKKPMSESVICKLINDIDDWDSLVNDYSLNFHFKEFMDEVKTNEKINGALQSRIVEILEDLIFGEDDVFKAIDELEEFVNRYHLNLAIIDKSKIEEYYMDLITNYIDQEIDWLTDSITDVGEAHDKRIEIVNLITRLQKMELSIDISLSEFDNYDWMEISLNNDFRRAMEKDD